MRLLLVEDERALAESLEHILKKAGNQVDLAYDGTAGLDLGLSGIYDVIILDRMLPGVDGLSITRELRLQQVKTPILMLTALGSVADRISGLDTGADDYLVKPAAPEELLARVRALSRRQEGLVMEQLTAGNLALRLSDQTAVCRDKSIRLPAKEFAILRLLMHNHGRIVSKEAIINKVWAVDSDAIDNNVEIYISFLRKKLAFLETDQKLTTVRKAGYILEDGNG